MAQLLEINTPLGERAVLLTHFGGREQLGQLPEYTLTFLCEKAEITANDLLARDITVGINLNETGSLRYFNGFITSLVDAGTLTGDYFGKHSRAYVYHATMHPWLWFLTRRSNCRIFQNKTVPDILESIFKEYPFAEFKRNLNATYRTWEYCCQYRETDFNFVCRLMEQEGIYFYFKHEDGKHVMQIGDGPSSHGAAPGFASVIFDNSEGGVRGENRLDAWHCSLKVQSGAFATTNYNFKTPKADLNARANKPGTYALNKFEIFDFGEEYEKKPEGDRYAAIRAEEMSARHEVYEGGGNVRGLSAGHTFKLTDHARGGFNKGYLVVAFNFAASDGSHTYSGGRDAGTEFHCNVTAVDEKTYYRPPRNTPKPVISGPQAAVVVGPAGEEIFTDEHGRAKVQFFWDRYSDANENSSCWIRIAQPIAGKEWGALFLPRIGQEVMVDFLEGDPDRPVISGRLYNADAKPPWQLPANKTRSGFKTRTEKGGGSNFNELRFEDKKGSEEIYIHAEKDNTVRIKHDRIEYVGNESHLLVKKDLVEKVANEHHLNVATDQNVKIGDSLSLNVSQDWHGKMGTLFAVDAGQEVHIKAGMKVVIEAGVQLTLKVGGNFITIDPSGVAIKGTLVQINSGGSAASGSGAKPDAPKDPKEAADSKGGSASSVTRPKKPEKYSPQATALKLAHKSAVPFCKVCTK